MRVRIQYGAALLACLGLMNAQASETAVTITVEPRQFTTDDAARLTVSLIGGSTPRPELPAVDGLVFTPAGQSSRMQSINGQVTTSKSFTYMVEALKEGRYTLPPVTAVIDGNIHKTAPVTLQVRKGQGRVRTRFLSPSSGRANPSVSDARTADEAGGVAFLRVQLGKTNPYIGELVPVQIKVYFREGLQASLNGLPAVNGGAFTLHRLNDQPRRSREIVGSQVFSVLTWYTGLSAIKEGKFPVSVDLDVTVLIPEERRRSRRSSSLFGGSLFDDDLFDAFAGFFGRMQEKNIIVRGKEETVEVRPLPAEGRPRHFSGAVGQFDVSAGATPRNLAVGDPVTIRVEVIGQGNFDRVSKPVFSSEEGLKIYNPGSEFTPRDTIGYEGVKVFEQVVIPRDGSITEIPSLEFSFFNPDRGRYETVQTAPIPVRISGGAPPVGKQPEPGIPVASDGPGDEMEEDEIAAAGPAGQRLALGRMKGSLRPLLFRPWFIGLQTGPAAVLLLGIFLQRRKTRRLQDPSIVRKKQANRAVDQAMVSMDRAIWGSDSAGFFHACRSTVQERLGVLWNIEPQAITPSDIRRRLPHATGMLRVFETADAASYSGATYTQDELKQVRRALKQELATLEGVQ